MGGASQAVSEPVVVLEDVRHVYPAERKQPAREALKGVSLSVRAGETFGLLGPNGGGKSTLFRILSTYFPPSAGRAVVFGKDVALEPSAVRSRLGVVFQNPSVDGKLTVAENLRHQGRLYGLTGRELERRSGRLLERYGLADRRADLVGTLSGGLRRRVELAKGLLHDPELILLDEPTTGLDPGARRELWDHLGELKKERRVTLIVTTHIMDEAERCDRLALLDRGSVAAQGAPNELKSEIGGDVVSIETPDPDALARGIEKRFGLSPARVGAALRLERPQGHVFIPQLVEAFPGLVSSVSLSKPTLEDVFVHHTGRRFWSEER